MIYTAIFTNDSGQVAKLDYSTDTHAKAVSYFEQFVRSINRNDGREWLSNGAVVLKEVTPLLDEPTVPIAVICGMPYVPVQYTESIIEAFLDAAFPHVDLNIDYAKLADSQAVDPKIFVDEVVGTRDGWHLYMVRWQGYKAGLVVSENIDFERDSHNVYVVDSSLAKTILDYWCSFRPSVDNGIASNVLCDFNTGIPVNIFEDGTKLT